MCSPIFSATLSILLAAGLLLAPGSARAYPLDGFENTGIWRLEQQRLVQEGLLPGRKRPSGELLPLRDVDLRLLRHRNLDLPPIDPQLTARLKRLIGPDVERYGVALLDLSDIEAPRYAEYHGHQRQNPGSIGKLLVALAIFQQLADIYPDDIEARKRVLRTAVITADEFASGDHHTVRFYDPETRTFTSRALRDGDQATLYTYLDWMVSPSSNAAAAMLEKHLILLAHFKQRYPVSLEVEKQFFADTPKQELGKIFVAAITEPVTRNGLDLDELRQGSFFTSRGKQLVPGTTSYATPRALMEFMLRLEQGRLVDVFSSREIKRLMYITERRIRYGSSGVLWPSAVYFKSGSLYSCQPEEGFQCGKYMGNKRNYMNSVAIIETPAGQNQLHYMVSVLSNVLRKNSAVDHRDLARAVHAMLLADHPDRGWDQRTYGEGFIGYEAELRAARLDFDVQETLTDLGYDVGEIDGQIGPTTRKAIRAFQASAGLPEDGQVSEALLSKMQEVARAQGRVRPTE